MPKEVLYLKLEQNAELSGESVHISDLGKLYCKTQSVQNRCRTLPVFRFEEKDKGRRVVSALFVISLLQQDNPNLEVESIGAPETVVEQVKVSRYPGLWQMCKIVFVCCICFFGAAFTIMAFHNDIGIREVFGQIYELLTGQEPQSVTALEIAYSIGLALGILVFFNHIGGRRITSDPTPIEVEMRKYEMDVNQALTETADREKKTLDVGKGENCDFIEAFAGGCRTGRRHPRFGRRFYGSAFSRTCATLCRKDPHGGKNFSVRGNGCLWNARWLSGKRISGRSNFWQGMVAEKVGSGSSF